MSAKAKQSLRKRLAQETDPDRRTRLAVRTLGEVHKGSRLVRTRRNLRKIGQRLEGLADASCDPLHPTLSIGTFENPNIAPVTPEYPR